jgi:CDP-6-deoxy-D-xylo-4-hexulose-3-dehydrase
MFSKFVSILPLTIKSSAPFVRSKFVQFLEDKKIQTRPYFAGNIILQPAYSHLMDVSVAKNNFPNATFTTVNTFFHGTSPVITPEQIEYIGVCVDEFMNKYG